MCVPSRHIVVHIRRPRELIHRKESCIDILLGGVTVEKYFFFRALVHTLFQGITRRQISIMVHWRENRPIIGNIDAVASGFCVLGVVKFTSRRRPAALSGVNKGTGGAFLLRRRTGRPLGRGVRWCGGCGVVTAAGGVPHHQGHDDSENDGDNQPPAAR